MLKTYPSWYIKCAFEVCRLLVSHLTQFSLCRPMIVHHFRYIIEVNYKEKPWFQAKYIFIKYYSILGWDGYELEVQSEGGILTNHFLNQTGKFILYIRVADPVQGRLVRIGCPKRSDPDPYF